MAVIATAGHVDHGKSTLVRALTGQDPDRLAEEHRRGLSIELGYCWTALPLTGDVAFVDVPGHERFLATMLAGVGPVSVVMLVVAADDPWMPQAAEHLAAIDAFGIRRGVLVVTRADLADPGPALARARAEVDRTSLAGAPDVVVSGRTGDGLDRLRAVLDDVLTASPHDDGDVRYWVDRVFSVAGAGTVVTGTLPGGTIRAGDDLELDGQVVRVRGLESLGREVQEAHGPTRVALRLGGRAPGSVRRGVPLLTPGAYAAVTSLDVRLVGPGHPPERPMLHVGSGRASVHLRPLGADTARVRLATPLPLRHGDRIVLRDPGSRSLWGADVLDADPPSLARRGAARRRAAELETLTFGVADEVRRRGAVRRSRLRQLGVNDSVLPDAVVLYDDWLVSAQQVPAWRARAIELLSARADGLSPAAMVRALDLPHAVLLDLVAVPPVVVRSGRLLLPAPLPTALARALAEVRSDLEEAPFRAPEATRLAALGLDGAALARLGREGHLLRLNDGVLLLPGADEAAYDVLVTLTQPFTTSQARQALDTSRRVVLPLLAHLDRAGRTVRLPDDTRRVVVRG